MEYMESKMQDYYDAGNAKAEAIWEAMKHFEDYFLSFQDVDETLIKELNGHFDYRNEDVQVLWCFFRRGAGV